MGEILFLLLIAGIDIIYFAETFTYKKPLFDNTGGPAVFPRVVLILLLACLLVRILQILAAREKRHFVLRELFCGSTGVFLLAFAGYIFFMEPLGIILDTILYLGFTSHYMIYVRDGSLCSGRKILLHMASFAVIAVSVYWFFSTVLNVAVPRGLLSFLNF